MKDQRREGTRASLECHHLQNASAVRARFRKELAESPMLNSFPEDGQHIEGLPRVPKGPL